MSDCTVHALFPTPVYVTTYKRDNTLEDFLKNLKVAQKFSNNEPLKQLYGTHSNNLKILREKECVELRQFILRHAKNLGNQVLGYDVEEYVDVLSWVSIKNSGEQHVAHTHPNSVISGVYYFDVNTTPLSFIDSTRNPTQRVCNISIPKNIKSESTFATESVSIHIKVGDIVLFPSYLKHNVLTNTTNLPRYSLAFNIVPKYNFGQADELTSFDYGDAI